ASNSYNFSKGDRVRGASAQLSARANGASGQSARATNFCSSSLGQTQSCSLTDDSFREQERSVKEAPKFSVGSSWGQEAKDEVRHVSFERDTSYPFCQLELFYDTRENLEEIG